MNTPNELRYTRSDEWVRIEGDIATIGITDYAQSVPPAGRGNLKEGVINYYACFRELWLCD